jgi:hypothetical protein
MVKLEFNCDQDWDNMKPTACGRFCTVCNKEVHDFRYKSLDEIKRRQQLEGKVCGVFLPEQVDQELIPLSFGWLERWKVWLATIATLLGLETAKLYAQSPPKSTIEVVDQKKIPEAPANKKNDVVNKADENGEDILSTPSTKPPAGKSKYYLSKRFPFIHKRRKFMGRIMMGCPSF